MKNKLVFFIIILLVAFSVVFMFYQNNSMANQKLLEEKRQEVKMLLQEQLETFNPALEAFVDKDYKTVISSEINSEGIVKFERGLTKNKEAFGNYIVKYDLKNMEVLSKELIISNGKEYSDKWNSFKEEY
ncbi:hypothetical protein VBD025_16030 [Virgibacillus flavescens]|uniref:hypothetical protein n=1 Tax=Virgibacillus flavescens TaxID=1611422 RepID=UPI003D339531